ncbi:PQQ-dependent sugar dehydrogenase [Gordonia jinhuaensis]|uniref:Glucose/Sorbosone dehydrogenase domain-containing protein n=1 Tax=Gordonia jinhuaensis TaxID=1517702 RepID=A0A916SXM0_9ACTN|nr:PQQ-dependent sugar dehydrogenase [Gordonia jinhuaensis]GGB22861.1 hypothetical protein GCM10011489_08880 [Gordonia jinhuaensis]
MSFPRRNAARPRRRRTEQRRTDLRSPAAAFVAILATAALAVTGCDFSSADRDSSAGTFSENPDAGIMSVPPQPPASQDNGDQGAPPATEAPGPCVDPDPAVIITCLSPTSAVLPTDNEGNSAMVAERTTGNIIAGARGSDHRVVASFPVDPAGDGGLLDFALSPTYDQDQLIYAYVSTASDNEVVRIAPGDTPKPILTGIPKGTTGNGGSLYFRSPGELLVATGNAGDPAAAANPASLAGKLLSVTDLTSGSGIRPKILMSGLGAAASLCAVADGSAVYLTDRAPTEDRLQQISATGAAHTLWTWPDKPGIAGCAATAGALFVSATTTRQILELNAPTRDRPTVSAPSVVLDKKYGAVGPLAALPSGLLQFGTVNKDAGGKPVSTDDRVVRYLVPASSDSRA